MKRLLLLIIGFAGVLGCFADCADMGPNAQAVEDEQLRNTTGGVPGMPAPDSLGAAEEPPAQRVPGE